MKLILSILFLMSTTTLFAEVVKAYDCKMIASSNMKRLVLTVVPANQGANNEYKFTIFFTKADAIITNRVLRGKAVVGDQAYVNVAMDKDPYDGQVGTFYWSFRMPKDFITGTIPAEFGTNPIQIMAYKWQGTPANQGNNSGIGFVNHWSCRSLND